jgi:anaerobic magnesium-protoporphyrin IX monomethyl ester cyclase
MKILFYYRGSEQLGIEALTGILKREGHQVGLLFDPGADNVFYFQLPILKRLRIEDRLVKQAIEFQPDVVAFSCLTNLYPYVKSIANRLKQHLNVPFVIGGVHPSTLPDKIFKDEIFDYLCIGEGDYAFLDLVQAINKGEDTTAIKNIDAKIDGKIYKNDQRPLIQNLDELPLPDKGLFYDRGAFSSSLLFMTSRGCPFKCSFCVNNFYNELKESYERPVRQKSVDYAIREVKSALYYGKPRTIDFMDDIFGLQPAWLEEFASVFPKKIGIPFLCNVYPSAVTKKYAALLKKSGCEIVAMGVQSGSPAVRSKMLRKETNQQIEESTRYLVEAGIKVYAEFIFGYTDETADQMWESVELSQRMVSNGSTSLGTFIFYPFPNTEAQRQTDAMGLINEDQRKSIAEGYGSYKSSIMLDQPYKNEALNLASLLPLFSKLPPFFTERYLQKIYRRPSGSIVKVIGIISTLLLANSWFFSHYLNPLRMLLRVFFRPKFLQCSKK